MAANIKQVILVVISLIVIATIMPLAIGMISMAGDVVLTVANATGLNESAITVSDVADPAVITLMTVLLPILAIIGVTMYFLPRFKD